RGSLGATASRRARQRCQQARPEPPVVRHRQGGFSDRDDAQHGGAVEEARLQAGVRRERGRAHMAELARLSVDVRSAVISTAAIVDELERRRAIASAVLTKAGCHESTRKHMNSARRQLKKSKG